MLHGWKEDSMLVKRHLFNRLRAIARYWSEIATFSYPLAFDAPVGVIHWDDLPDFWRVSCRMARLQYGAKIFQKS